MKIKGKKCLLLGGILSIVSCMGPSTVVKETELKNKKLTPAFFKNHYTKIQERLKKDKKLLHNAKKPEESLEWYLDAGSIARYAYDLNTSFKIWDFADRQINIYEQKLLAEKGFQEAASILVNDLVKDYKPPIYERIFVNIFQALNALSMNDISTANVELNRAIDRLKYAENIFKKEVEQAQKEAEKEKKGKQFQITNKTLSPIEKAYSNLDRFKAYSKFENPFVYYLKGILYYERGEYSNAVDMFKTAYGLIKDKEPAQKVVEKDWELARSPLNTKHYAWVIYLNGLSFEKVEKRFDIPVFLVSRDVLYTGIALPWLKERTKTSDSLLIQTPQGTYKTYRLVNVDNLVAWEFKQRLPSIVMREIIRATVKTLIQYEANKRIGLLAGIAAAVYQAATTKADTRQWYWLPKEIQVARIEFQPNQPIRITVPGHLTKEFKFDDNVKDAIIIVRGFKPQDEVWYYVATFKK